MQSAHEFFTQLGVRHPIIQAPMAGVATPRLAAEVSNAGALGSLGLGASTVAQARQMIDETRALTNHPINVNVSAIALRSVMQRTRQRGFRTWLPCLSRPG